MAEQKWDARGKISLTCRIAILVLGIISFSITLHGIYLTVVSGQDPFLAFDGTFRFYTIQSNLIVLAWVAISLILIRREKNQFFHAIAHGAMVLYITITLLIFAILLSPLYQPTEINAIVTNILFHYLIPSFAIFDWFLTNTRFEYKWRYALYWLSYPFIYLAYTLIRGIFFNTYPYPFLDLNTIGTAGLVISTIMLSCLYIALGALFIFMNKKLRQRVAK